MKKYFLPFLFLAFFTHCTSSTTSQSPEDNIVTLSEALAASDFDVNPNSLIPFTLTYKIKTTLTVTDDENSPYVTETEQNLVFPFYVDINTKTAYMMANEFPSFISRVCASEELSTDCDFIYEGLGEGEMVDIVFDSCGDGLSNSKCGPKDATLFSGEFDLDTGSFDINNLAIRVRAFEVTDEEDGSNAQATDDGMVNLERINAALSTASSVGGSPFTTSGKVVLGAKGIIPSGFSELEGASYTAIVTGTISPNPFDDE